MTDSKKTAIFIVPRSSTSWRGNEAGWITTAGWASAAKQLWGDAKVATTDGVFSPEECRLFPRNQENVSREGSKLGRMRMFIPEMAITAYKDWQLLKSKPDLWPIELAELTGKQVQMIWQRHDLFPGVGRKLADQLGVPLLTQVEAAVVWEARKWGIKRPLWGKWLEKKYEASALIGSDLVSCVSEELQEKVISMGVPRERVIVSHNRVDSSVFHPGILGDEIRKSFNLESKKVLGWTGSFRSFHGLDVVLKAFKRVQAKHQNAVLMLVGDGLEFDKMHQLRSELKLDDSVIFTGRKSFIEVPKFVAAFDVAIVSASSSDGFHYSPLKLREYLAARKATIAPKAGNLPEIFADGDDLVLYDTGSIEDLSEKMIRLLTDGALHQRLKHNAMNWFESEGTWVHEMKKVCNLLGISYDSQSP